MIDLFIYTSLLGLLATGAAIAVISVLVIRYRSEIISWFQQHTALLANNANNVAFTLAESMKSGDYKVVQGIFNKSTNQLHEARRVTSTQVDEEFEHIHANDKLAVYQ
jgi:hypothetical protein